MELELGSEVRVWLFMCFQCFRPFLGVIPIHSVTSGPHKKNVTSRLLLGRGGEIRWCINECRVENNEC